MSHSSLTQLTKLLKEKNLDALIVDHEDPHASECPHDTFGRVEFISGFTGTFGHALVTHEKCYLWTDSRYWIQAERQLKSPWVLMKYFKDGEPTLLDVLASSAHIKRVGFDLFTTQYRELKRWTERLPNKEFVGLEENPLDSVWYNRPPFPSSVAKIHPLEHCGETLSEKVAKVRSDLAKKEVDALALTMLDEIAYLLNLRGSDTHASPFLYSYLVLEMDKLTFFVAERKLDDEVRNYLKKFNVTVKEYNEVFKYLEELGLPKSGGTAPKFKLWVSRFASAYICSSFLKKNTDKTPRELLIEETPVSLRKAVKNDVEIKSMIRVHEQDSIALCRLFGTLEDMKNDGSLFKETEYWVAELCNKFRADEGSCGVSFDPISSIGPNCAIVHYKPTKEKCVLMAPQIYLLDSGGQWVGGTTDVTRVLHFGTPSKEERECYTLALKGHLAIRHIVFPEGTTGQAIDILARQFLWKTGRNYYHGTGHGIGIWGEHKYPIEPGVVLANEPGFYKRDAFGVRIENAIYTKRVDDPNFSKDDTKYLEFDDLTLVPYCKELIDVNLLTQEERDWVNEYHRRVASVLLPLIESDKTGKYTSTIKYIKRCAEPL